MSLCSLIDFDYLFHNSSWNEMIWNITGNVETGSIDSKEELCTRF